MVENAKFDLDLIDLQNYDLDTHIQDTSRRLEDKHNTYSKSEYTEY
jgi:hypothetical protein